MGLVRRSKHHIEKIDLPVALDVTVQSAKSPPRPSKRTSSLLSGLENANPYCTTFITPATIRHYRSMLEIEEPPSIGPLDPMSFDELYDDPHKDDPPPVEDIPVDDSASGEPEEKPKETIRGSGETDCQTLLPLHLLALLLTRF